MLFQENCTRLVLLCKKKKRQWFLPLCFSLLAFAFGGNAHAEVWSSIVNLSAAGVDASHAHNALNNSGQGVVVWERGGEIQAITFTFGVGWSTPETISSVSDTCSIPQVEINDSGQTVAIWKRQNGSTYDIQVATLLFGGSWSAPTSLCTLASADVNFPCAAINASGQVLAAWTHSDGSNFIVEAATLTFGGAWSAPTALSTTGMDATDTRVVIDNTGNMAVLWIRNDVIQSILGDFGVSWSNVTNLSVQANVENPKLFITSDGDLHASWRRIDGTWRIYETGITNSLNKWKTPQYVSKSEKSLDHIDFDISEQGFAVVSWNTPLLGNVVIMGLTFKASRWGTISLLSDLGQDASNQDAVLNNFGQVLVIWQRSDGTNQIIQSRTTTI